MAVHSHIGIGTSLETKKKSESAKRVLDSADADLKTALAEVADAKKKLDAATTTWSDADTTAINSWMKTAGAGGDAEKAAVLKKAADDRKAAGDFKSQKDKYEESYKNSLLARDKAQEVRDKAEVAVSSTSSDWVQIPNALLALAGIAIGSGVFSSLIASINSEGKTACATSLNMTTPSALKTRFADANGQASSTPMIIEGTNFGVSGRVRSGKSILPLLYWSTDGKAIAVDISAVPSLKNIVIETANGKLAYEVTGSLANPILGLPQFIYDLADLFRDDKNPSIFSLMKFQMFGWTVVAIGIYSWIFLTNLSPNIPSLPAVDQSIVLLTGLSQGGYLAGKAVSNIGKPNPAS